MGQELPDGTSERTPKADLLCVVYLDYDSHGHILTLNHERHGDPYPYPRSPILHQYDLP
jgi:hypothetical protein